MGGDGGVSAIASGLMPVRVTAGDVAQQARAVVPKNNAADVAAIANDPGARTPGNMTDVSRVALDIKL
jgi:hypothetical protein